MFFAGIDAGSAATKAVILQNREILGHSTVNTGANVKTASENALNKALDAAKLASHDLTRIISTGYGRRNIDFSNGAVTEITAHAKGARYLFPNARTIIDIGGQDSKVISLDEDGRIINFLMNDKCAAGTGRFLEVMARTLDTTIQELSELAVSAQRAVTISSMCTVFAESEVVSLIAQGEKREVIVAGLYEAISKRIWGMAKQVGLQNDVIFTGGVAKSLGIKMSLEKVLGHKVFSSLEPQINGALGAALLAEEQAR